MYTVTPTTRSATPIHCQKFNLIRSPSVSNGRHLIDPASPQASAALPTSISGHHTVAVTYSIPAAGAELRGTFPSAVQTYRHFGLSSVDDLDLPIGRVALAVLLSPDGITGHYGLQDVDDAVLPQIPPVTSVVGG